MNNASDLTKLGGFPPQPHQRADNDGLFLSLYLSGRGLDTSFSLSQNMAGALMQGVNFGQENRASRSVPQLKP